MSFSPDAIHQIFFAIINCDFMSLYFVNYVFLKVYRDSQKRRSVSLGVVRRLKIETASNVSVSLEIFSLSSINDFLHTV